MSDAIKWVLLVAGILIIIALILALPIADAMNLNAFGNGITAIINNVGIYFKPARGFLNNLVLPNIGPPILTAVISWTFIRYFSRITIKIITWVYHFIFK